MIISSIEARINLIQVLSFGKNVEVFLMRACNRSQFFSGKSLSAFWYFLIWYFYNFQLIQSLVHFKENMAVMNLGKLKLFKVGLMWVSMLLFWSRILTLSKISRRLENDGQTQKIFILDCKRGGGKKTRYYLFKSSCKMLFKLSKLKCYK